MIFFRRALETFTSAPLQRASRAGMRRAVRTLTLLPLYAVGVCLACIAVGAQSTPQSPIKVHGGSTTFFTHDQNGWVALPGQPNTFCTAISAYDLNQIHVSGFYGMTREFTRAGERNGVVRVHAFDWRIEFLGHDPQDARQFRVQPQGIVLQASRLDCNEKRTGTPSLRISPLSGAAFYGTDLLPTQLYPGNKRFRATNCSGESVDLCERTAQVRVFPSSNLKDPQPPVLTLNCPDGACTVFVGRIRNVSLAPTVRAVGRADDPRAAKP